MAQQPEDKKMDFSSLPRAAISLKGLPVSRNTRLPSIRSPRDLTLGAPPKRTFMPNIPPRREKKLPVSDKTSTKMESGNFERKPAASPAERGRGRGRGKANIIQTEGSIFSDGIAENLATRKARTNDSYQRSDFVSSSKSSSIQREKMEKDVAGVSRQMSDLFRDDFIDDGDDEGSLSKPIIFPPIDQVKKEVKNETAEPPVFDPDVAKEMGFDVNRVAQFIKKEKGTEIEEKEIVENTEIHKNELTDFLNEENPKLVLLQFPLCITVSQKVDIDTPPESQPKGESTTDSKASDEQNSNYTSIRSLPEGKIGKLQVLKSGKARLIIEGLHFDLDSLSSLATRNELVSIRTNSNVNDLTVLGYMKHKLKFVPNVDSLLS